MRSPRRQGTFVALVLAMAAPALLGSSAPDEGAAEAFPGCAPAEHPGGDWRMYGHDLSNTRHQPAETTIGPDEARTLAPAWELATSAVEASGSFTGTPVVADGCVYVGSTAGWVIAANADTGEMVWTASLGRAINNSVTVHDGRVFVLSGLRALALDQATGATLWESEFIDEQDGADLYGAPVVHTVPPSEEGGEAAGDVLFVGVSGGAAELGDEETRYSFQGRYALLDASTGAILERRWTIPQDVWEDGYAGAGVWATPALDPGTGHIYVGSANPFRPQVEHDHANAVLKIDVDPRRPTFGDIVGSYKGTLDEYVPGADELPCADIPGNPPPWYPQGVGACADADLDFGASPNLFPGPDGRLLVGEGQKSGEYHVIDAETMALERKFIAGAPTAVGGIVGSTSFTGTSVIGPVTHGGYLWSADPHTGSLQWASPVGDLVHWAHPVSTANGVAYTIDVPGLLRAYDAATGAPLLAGPQSQASPVGANLGGGVAIARNTVYAVTGSYLVAHRPGGALGGGGGGPGLPPTPAPPAAGGHVVAQPGSFAAGYTTPLTIVTPPEGLTFDNFDAQPHDVVAFGHFGSDDAPWCDTFAIGKCPLFWSKLIGLGTSTEVQGIEALVAGETYDFYCSIHPSMRGQIVVSSASATG